ncbi:MAG: hypothetical protein OHK0015_54190 [Chloroflexi bacterium OHK40]
MHDRYSQPFTFSATLSGEAVVVVSKPGLPGGRRVDDAVALAAELLAPAPCERVLLLGCGHGALGVPLARRLPRGQLVLHDPSLIAVRMARCTLEANGVVNAQVSERVSQLPEGAGTFDRVVLLAPQSRALGRRWLVEARALLRPGGILTVAGANAEGVQPLIADTAVLFGATHTLGYGRGCRVAEARHGDSPPEPAWARAPGIAPGTWHILQAELPGGGVELASLPGVFSYERIDAGTAFLLQQLELGAGLRVLDVGCGYGPIGVAAARAGAARVDLLDASLLALAAARENIVRLGLLRAEAHASDALETVAGRRYDLVVSNPPFHAGRQVDTAMAEAFIGQARALLAPGGRMALVANRFLPYERSLGAFFARVATVAESRSYRILVGEV